MPRGFGDRTALAYSAALDSAVLTVAASDERLVHADDGSLDHAQIVQDFERIGEGHPGARVLVAEIAGYADDNETAGDRCYRFVIDTTLAGLERRLTQGGGA